ncbi:MAG: lysylphosphatidylglycerol synthase transmembrane domain-containing protein [Sulfuricella sp.]
MTQRRRFKAALRWGAAAALLSLILWLAGPQKLLRTLAGVDPVYFLVALLFSIASNLVSAVRWAHLARMLGLQAPTGQMIVFYARGITANSILPGATLSGDMLRGYQLHRMGNSLLRSGISVLFDRVSGLWVLTLMSLLAAMFVWAGGETLGGPVWHKSVAVASVLAVGILLPFTLGFARWWSWLPIKKLVSVIDHCVEAMHALLGSRAAMIQLMGLSVGVQMLSITALWLCGFAAGLQVPFVTMAMLAAPIFIMAAVPAGLGGWGTRELAAILLFGALGYSADMAATTGILYGLCGLAQAILAVPLMMKRFNSEGDK